MIRDALTAGDWEPFIGVDGLSDLVGPIWTLPVAFDHEKLRVGFRVEAKHCNNMMTCHGGMLAMFADSALGANSNLMSGLDNSTPTVSLSMDYLQSAKLGEWVESRVKVLRMTRSLSFVEGHLITSNGIITRASATFKRRTPAG